MKRLLLPSLAVSSLFLFTVGCGEKPVVTQTAPPPVRLKPKPKVYRGEDLKAEEAARDAAMAREIAELEAEAERLRQEIAEEQLAMDRAALEEEQRRLDQDRLAWLNRQVAEAARTKPVTPVSTPAPVLPPVRDFSYFHSELSIHGSWFQSVDYGYVWQPAVALQSSWRPYTVGRWADCDRGWTWLSDEPFGWAVYHYGRWTKLKGCGWIWVPGEVWAPAWVAWRRSEKYVGWCPLPPETLYQDKITYDSSVDKLCGLQPSHYIFITVKQFCLPVHRHGEPAERGGVACRDTVNITRLRVSGDRVDCSGPKYEWVRDRLPSPPGRYVLTSDPHAKGDRSFRIERDKLCVFSPVMRAPWNAGLRPREVAGPLPATVAVPEGVAPSDKLRQRFREEKKAWLAASGKALQGESARRLIERQARVEDLLARVQNPLPPRPPGEGGVTLPQPGVKPAAATVETSLAERRAQREQVRKEVNAQQAALAKMRGLPVKNGTAPSRVVMDGGRAVSPQGPPVDLRKAGAPDQTLVRAADPLPGVVPQVPEVLPVEVPRGAEAASVTAPGTVGSAGAGAPGKESIGAGSGGTIAEVPPANPDVIPPEVIAPEAPVRSAMREDLEARRAEVARLKETQARRQQQMIAPPRDNALPNLPARPDASGQPGRRFADAGVGSAAGPEQQVPPAAIAEPEPPVGAVESVTDASAARRDAATALAERREKAARVQEELALRQQALQQQREARERTQAEHEQALAQSAAEAARQSETAQAAQLAAAAEAQKQQQLAAEHAARQQELSVAAARQQQQEQAQLAKQAAAARDQEQRETESNRLRVAAERARIEEQAAREQAQRQAEALARQEEMILQQREAAEQARQEQAAREEAMRQAEERARQEEMARQQREAAEQARQEQAAREEAQRQAEERARQEEMARQQREAAERARQEQAAREEAMRQAEERARQEEMARQQREAAERERAAREQAAREQAQREAAEEAAKNGNK